MLAAWSQSAEIEQMIDEGWWVEPAGLEGAQRVGVLKVDVSPRAAVAWTWCSVTGPLDRVSAFGDRYPRHTGQMKRAHTANTPGDQVLSWAAKAVEGTRVLSSVNVSRSDHRPSGTFRLRIEVSGDRTTDVILKVPVERWVFDAMVRTNARALQLAETNGLAAPRLVAADLDGMASGSIATLETLLSGSADLPPTVSVARLQEAGAAIARVNSLSMEPQADLPHRPRPIAVDDCVAERRLGRMPTTPLLQQAGERVRSHREPGPASVFVHGDVWGGNMLWEDDRCVALIDWKTAGVGDPGVDLGSLRMQMALQYGLDAPDHVLEGWQRRPAGQRWQCPTGMPLPPSTLRQ